MSNQVDVQNSNRGERLLAVDALRGLIIILMALDHANYFIAQQHSSGEYWGGSFPAYDHILPFLTRVLTHLCAPGFFFLMGVGMLLFAEARRVDGWSELKIMAHFWLRGALLIALQLLVVNRAWELAPKWQIETYFGVLLALGVAMILGSFLLRLGPGILIALFVLLLVGTELLVPAPDAWGQVFHQNQYIMVFAGGRFPSFWVNYPALAWLELVVFGLLFGRWLLQDKGTAYRRALYIGMAFLLAFVLIRALDGFGNLRPRPGDGWMDFLNPVKYPPSIAFTLLTMGVNLCTLQLFAWISDRRSSVLAPLSVFGRAPLFFYVLHLFLYAGLGLWFAPRGTSLPVMYLFWLAGLLLLYPLCRWYARFKNRQPAGSLLRMF